MAKASKLAAEPPAVDMAGNPYQLTLAGMKLPLPIHFVFNLASAACCALLGHPWVGVLAFIGCCAIDTIYQRRIRGWLAQSPEIAEAVGFRRLALLSVTRAGVYLAPAVAMALTGGAGEAAYLGVVISTIIALACAFGSLARLMFWSFAGPALLAGAIGAVGGLHGLPVAALLTGLAVLALLLALICEGTTRAIGAWHDAFNSSRAMIPELEAARDRAVAERRAADEAREEARRANRAKSSFLATMSHEIRTPMNGVLGMAQLLRRDEANPRQIERLDTLIESGEYLLSILNDILDVSKIDAGRLEIAPQPENLRQFLEGAVQFWAGRADEKGVALALQADDDVPEFVSMDALRLRQVLFNLVGNALKFTEVGSVTISARARPNGPGAVWLHLVVSDTGPGIAAHHLPALFERFSQVDESEVRRFGGTGLGLAIAKQLIELMEGRIWAESELGRGSAFHLELPLELAAAPDVAAAAAPAGDGESLAQLDVLIVDDNPVNLLVLDQLLGALGHRVVQAASGPEALQALAGQPFDLVMMDIQMPGMSGIEALERLRGGQGPNRQVPVIALTADVTSGGRQRYLDLGFTEHGSKPIQIPEMMGAIARAVAPDQRSEQIRASV